MHDFSSAAVLSPPVALVAHAGRQEFVKGNRSLFDLS